MIDIQDVTMIAHAQQIEPHKKKLLEFIQQHTPFTSRAELEKALQEAGWGDVNEESIYLEKTYDTLQDDFGNSILLNSERFVLQDSDCITHLQCFISSVTPALLQKLGVK